jgi:hypothetical protein
MSASRPPRLTSAPTAAEGGWVRADRDAPGYHASAQWSRKIGVTGFPIDPAKNRESGELRRSSPALVLERARNNLEPTLNSIGYRWEELFSCDAVPRRMASQNGHMDPRKNAPYTMSLYVFDSPTERIGALPRKLTVLSWHNHCA